MTDLSRRNEKYSISDKPDTRIEKARVIADSEMWREKHKVTVIPTGIGKRDAGNWNNGDKEGNARRKRQMKRKRK